MILVPMIGVDHAPLAVQAVALVLDQRRVVDLPTATLEAATLKVSVGEAGWANESSGSPRSNATTAHPHPRSGWRQSGKAGRIRLGLKMKPQTRAKPESKSKKP